MVAAVPTAATGSWHAQIVRERAQLRRLAEVGVRITQMAHGAADGARDATSAADLAQQWVHEATTATTAQPDLAPVSDWSQQAMAELLADEEPGIPTGLRDLDTLTGGWRPGQMVVVAGRPAMGKSTLVAGMALAAAQAGHRTLLASCEMPAQDILWRLWTAEARVPMHRVFGRQLSPQDVSALEAARQRVDDLPLHITDSAATPMQIRAAARRLSQTHGPLGMVAVDYLQRLQPDHRRDRRDLEVGEAARTLKNLAMDMDAAVITAAQLNRGLEQRMDKRPQLSDLRESGEIEQEADVVLLLHRDDYYDKESPRAGEADLIVAKNRNGPTDTISVAAQLHLARFVDLAR